VQGKPETGQPAI